MDTWDGFGTEQAGEDNASAQPSPAGRVVVALRRDASRVLANWALRVANLPAFRAVPDLRLAEIQNAMPATLAAVPAATATIDPTIDTEPLAYAGEVAAAHGRKRRETGFDLGVMLTEFGHLRSEVWAAVYRIVDEDPSLAAAPRELQERLNPTLDAVLIAAAEAWLAAG